MGKGLRIAGFPIHPAIVHAPLTLLPASLVCDGLARATGGAFWNNVGFYALVVGLAIGAIAAVAGLLDYFAIPRGHAGKATATLHMVVMVCAVASFVAAAVLRREPDIEAPGIAIFLEALGTLIAVSGAAIGHTLILRHGIGREIPEATRPPLGSPVPRTAPVAS